MFRCTTAGTSGGTEPAWNLTKGATTNDNTAVWTEVTGNSTYNWTAPHARIKSAVGSGWAAAGDDIYVAHNHAETQAAIMTWSSSGTTASPNKVVCVTSAGSVPPVSADLRTTATVSTTGASGINLGGYLYVYGIGFSLAGGGSNVATLQLNSAVSAFQYYDSCSFTIASTSTSTSCRMLFGTSSSASNVTVTENCTIAFGAASGQNIGFPSRWIWKNTASAIGGANFPTPLVNNADSTSVATWDGVDLSAYGSGKTLVGTPNNLGYVQIKNCKLGSSVTIATTPTKYDSMSTELYISDSADTHNRQEKYSYAGTLSTETTIVRSSGASDGDTSIAWKVVTTANSKWHQPFECFPIAIWNTSVGSSKTATVEIVNDGTTLQDDDIWMDVEYLGTSGFPLASKASTRSADILNAGTNLTTSSVTWTTTGLGSPVKQYMWATFTPQEIGYIRATVYVAKASQTVYIDPVLTIA